MTPPLTPPLTPGTRVRKINSDPNDIHKDGALGVIASVFLDAALPNDIRLPSGKVVPAGTFVYLVLWDDFNEVVAITGTRLVACPRCAPGRCSQIK